MMCTHELRHSTSEAYESDEQEKNRHHEDSTVGSCPLCERWVIGTEILRLEDSETSDYDDEKEGEDTRLWYPEESIGRHSFSESFLEHLERGEEDDEESYPLYARIFLQKSRDITRCDDHEDDRDDESDHEIYDISVTGSRDGEDIVQWHRDVGYDDSFDSRGKSRCAISMTLFMMFVSADLSIKFPDDIEE